MCVKSVSLQQSVKKNKILTQISSRTANFCILDPQGTWFSVPQNQFTAIHLQQDDVHQHTHTHTHIQCW